MAKIGWPKPKQPARIPVDQVARNVLENVRKFSATIHRQVYANGNGYAPAEILAALGNRADEVHAILNAAARANAPTAITPPVVTPTAIMETPSTKETQDAESKKG